MNWLCKIGIHSWGRVKQWLTAKGVVHSPRCKRCGKIKE